MNVTIAAISFLFVPPLQAMIDSRSTEAKVVLVMARLLRSSSNGRLQDDFQVSNESLVLFLEKITLYLPSFSPQVQIHPHAQRAALSRLPPLSKDSFG